MGINRTYDEVAMAKSPPFKNFGDDNAIDEVAGTDWWYILTHVPLSLQSPEGKEREEYFKIKDSSRVQYACGVAVVVS